ncbi:hypothetical protein F5H01DRAFT_330404 [Linnemannia elongata]|nr:hypothetical protein F5H01DRAFT_330404 [Linnemannia elongata]
MLSSSFFLPLAFFVLTPPFKTFTHPCPSYLCSLFTIAFHFSLSLFIQPLSLPFCLSFTFPQHAHKGSNNEGSTIGNTNMQKQVRRMKAYYLKKSVPWFFFCLPRRRTNERDR